MNGFPVVASVSFDESATDALRLARATAAQPQGAGDWNLSSLLNADLRGYLSITSLNSSCALVVSRERESGLAELIALHPRSLGLEGLDGQWTAQEINPDLTEDDSYRPTLFSVDNHLVCLYWEHMTVWGDDTSVKCAVADVTPHFSQ